MRIFRASALAILCLLAAGSTPAHAASLNLDIYALPPPPTRPDPSPHELGGVLQPADPRRLRGESLLVRRAMHAGYGALGLAGLAVSAASGGVAPAVGFGIVALIHGIGLLTAREPRRRGP